MNDKEILKKLEIDYILADDEREKKHLKILINDYRRK